MATPYLLLYILAKIMRRCTSYTIYKQADQSSIHDQLEMLKLIDLVLVPNFVVLIKTDDIYHS